jgi:hypothetical protein
MGMVRARYRDSLEKPKLLKPGGVVQFTIRLNATSNGSGVDCTPARFASSGLRASPGKVDAGNDLNILQRRLWRGIAGGKHRMKKTPPQAESAAVKHATNKTTCRIALTENLEKSLLRDVGFVGGFCSNLTWASPTAPNR